MNLSERTASLAGRPLPGSRLAALQLEVSRSVAGLSFANAALEADYQQDRASGCAAQAKGGLLLSVVLTLVFLALDHFALGMHYPWQITQLMVLVLMPICLAAWLAMGWQPCKPWTVQINTAVMVLAGLAFSWVIPQMVITSDRPPYAAEGLLLYVAIIYFLSGAMFYAATAIAMGMSLVFILSIAASKVSLQVVAYSAFFLVALNMVCVIGRYMLDKTYRRNFLTRMIAVELAERDPLTGIYNRRVFEDRLDTLLRQSQRQQTSLTVLVLDIDHFKRINDAGGHALGDSALRMMALALQDLARRPLDCVARLSGDEFAALWVGLPRSEIEGRVADLSARFISRSQVITEQLGSPATLSMGVAFAGDTTGHSYESLLHGADIALYRAKISGRGRTEIEELKQLVPSAQTAAA